MPQAQLALHLDPLPATDDTPYPATATATDRDLIADVLAPLDTAGPDRPAAILRAAGGLTALPTAERLSLVCEGVTHDEATQLLAAVELGRRLAKYEVPTIRPLDKPSAVAAYLALRYRRRDQEVMGALYLDRRHRLLRDEEVFRGTLSRAAVEPRPILYEALTRGATAVIVFHTHPTGDPSPSLEDLAFTERMAQAAHHVGIELLDHLIIAGVTRWLSLKEEGAF